MSAATPALQVPDLVIFFGPPAAGKAAIGSALAKITGFRFFHNHMTAEAVAALFGWGTKEFIEQAAAVRLLLLEKALAQQGAPSIIFTFVWAFDQEADSRFIDDLVSIAHANGGEVFFVELLATQAARMAREGTPFRLEHKPVKRDVERAREFHGEIDAQHRTNSEGDFPYPAHHLIVDTEKHEPDEAAEIVARHFGFPGHAAG